MRHLNQVLTPFPCLKWLCDPLGLSDLSIFSNYTILYLLHSNMITNRAVSAPLKDAAGIWPAGAAPGPICSPVTTCFRENWGTQWKLMEDTRNREANYLRSRRRMKSEVLFWSFFLSCNVIIHSSCKFIVFVQLKKKIHYEGAFD